MMHLKRRDTGKTSCTQFTRRVQRVQGGAGVGSRIRFLFSRRSVTGAGRMPRRTIPHGSASDGVAAGHRPAAKQQQGVAHGRQEKRFGLRMYRYNTRLFNRYNRKVISLAVLTDEDADWRPDRFG